MICQEFFLRFCGFFGSDGLLIQPGGKCDCTSPLMRRSLGAERRPASEGYT